MDAPTTPQATGARATAARAAAAPGDGCPWGETAPGRQLPQLGRGNFVHVAHASPTKNFGGEMLTWVWLARASHELTKPKSTFATPKIFCGR